MPEYVLSLLYDIVDNTLTHRRHYDLSLSETKVESLFLHLYFNSFYIETVEIVLTF